MKDERRGSCLAGEPKLSCDTVATYGTVGKALVTVLLAVWYWAVPAIGFFPVGDADGHGTVWGHVLWPLSHANVWHLMGNLWVLWWMKGGRLRIREAYVTAVLCSFLPVVPGVWDFAAAEPLRTVGFSGVLCAMIGMKWGEWIKGCNNVAAYRTFCVKVLPFVAMGFLIPHVNWSIHLYCLLAGGAYGNLSGRTAEHCS